MMPMSVRLGVAALLLAAAFVAAMAAVRGRESRYYHLLSAAISPVSQHFTRPAPAPLDLPFREDFASGSGTTWHRFQASLVDVALDSGDLSLTPTRESVWWNNTRGPMLYRTIAGDASVIVSVRTRKRSHKASPPDGEWQFGGVMLRDARGDAWMSRENYVFNVVGFRGKRLQVETKSTKNGTSQVDAWDWPAGDGQLRIERTGHDFNLYARHQQSEQWQRLISYRRPDLPEVLQVGLIIYAYSEGRGRHDMQVFFDEFSVH